MKSQSMNEKIAMLQTRIPELMATVGIPGVSVASIYAGKLVWKGTFGVKSIATQEPVEEDTIFEVASLSKPVFAYAALELCEKGVMDLDCPLAQYFSVPYTAWGFDPQEPRLAQVTMRQVLSHSAGFSNWHEDTMGKIHLPPGERFFYAGEGYIYLQRVIEHVTNTLLGQYMREQVIAPSGMNQSSYVWCDQYSKQAAEGYGERNEEVGRQWKTAFSAYSLYSTASDFATFLLRILNVEKDSTGGLAPNWVETMLTPQIEITETLAWGLGWGLLETKEGHTFWHWGDLGDYRCFTLAKREQKEGLVIMTNSERGLQLCEQLLEEVYGEEYANLLQWVKGLP